MVHPSHVVKQDGTLFSQLVRYTLSGGIAIVVTLAVYAAGWRILAALGARGDYLIADVIGWMAGMLVNYMLSRRWVFTGQRRMHGAQEFLVFASVGLMGLGWSQLGLRLLVGRWSLHRDLAKLIMAAAVFVWNFGARRALMVR